MNRNYLVIYDDPDNKHRYEVTVVAENDVDAMNEAVNMGLGVEVFLAPYGGKKDVHRFNASGIAEDWETYEGFEETAMDDWAVYAIAFPCSYGFENVLVPSDAHAAILLDAREWSAGNWPELVEA